MELLLNICIYLPLLGILGIIIAQNDKAAKWISLAATSSTFVLSLILMFSFNIAHSATPQFLTQSGPILQGYDIKYFMGLDGLSFLLFMLTALMGPIVILSSWNSVKKHVSGYFAMLLLLQTASMGVFASLDLILFYVFFELSLIPMYFIIGIWGGETRITATVKFFVYTLVGSLIMLVGLIYIGYDAGAALQGVTFTTDWNFLASSAYQPGLVAQTYLFLAFALAFCIKLPLFPFHTWQPHAYTQAPAAGTVMLAAIMSKMGAYGLLRFCLPILPNAFTTFAPYMAALAVIGILYGALVAMVQKDIKKLVAYSSISHLGFVVLGLFAFNVISVQGSILQMINHGLSTGALFLIVGMIYERRKTHLIDEFGGLARILPVFAVIFMIATLASIGLPGLNGFIGEFLILNGTFSSQILSYNAFTVFAALGIILSAVYMLWMYQRVMFGSSTKENKKLLDLNAREIGLLVPMVILIVWIGVHPVDFTRYSEQQVNQLLHTSNTKRAAIKKTTSQMELPAWASSLYDVHDAKDQMASNMNKK